MCSTSYNYNRRPEGVKWATSKGDSVDMRLKLDPAKEEKNGEHSGQGSHMERQRDGVKGLWGSRECQY